ncbi:unnamed protein product [Clavelina lepadiformis]|uniref:Uncharacterized protein n=1 Tax=Clavelina lepadiformis TaxID=159417 RepID=A0ABP0GN87_CLALP
MADRVPSSNAIYIIIASQIVAYSERSYKAKGSGQHERYIQTLMAMMSWNLDSKFVLRSGATWSGGKSFYQWPCMLTFVFLLVSSAVKATPLPSMALTEDLLEDEISIGLVRLIKREIMKSGMSRPACRGCMPIDFDSSIKDYYDSEVKSALTGRKWWPTHITRLARIYANLETGDRIWRIWREDNILIFGIKSSKPGHYHYITKDGPHNDALRLTVAIPRHKIDLRQEPQHFYFRLKFVQHLRKFVIQHERSQMYVRENQFHKLVLTRNVNLAHEWML